MSRQLPEKPNLEYLKKQAKELLRSMRQGKLADAQHTLANEYGFATWAKLKSHVEALGLSPAEALKAAVCDMRCGARARGPRAISGAAGEDRRSAARLRLRPTRVIRRGAAERSRDHRRAAARGRQHPEANRMVGRRIRRAGRLRSEPGGVSDRARRGARCAFSVAAGDDGEAARVGGGRSGAWSTHAAETGRRRCTSPPPWRLRSSCSRTAPRSTRATWITNRRPRSTCCAWIRSGTIRRTARMWRATWCRADAGRTF